ncbi:hypothetical protein VCHENC02_2570, partial [Vibrio harveyi]
MYFPITLIKQNLVIIALSSLSGIKIPLSNLNI